MEDEKSSKRRQSFLLRLPHSLREEAIRLAKQEGISLNHFISLALTEKISRMGAQRAPVPPSPPRPDRF